MTLNWETSWRTLYSCNEPYKTDIAAINHLFISQDLEQSTDIAPEYWNTTQEWRNGKWISSNDAAVWQTGNDDTVDRAPVVSHYLMHVPYYEHRHTDGHTTGSQRDTRLSVNVVVWVREVYWQRRCVFLLLDATIEWMVHVNYKSPMNHLVFS